MRGDRFSPYKFYSTGKGEVSKATICAMNPLLSQCVSVRRMPFTVVRGVARKGWIGVDAGGWARTGILGRDSRQPTVFRLAR